VLVRSLHIKKRLWIFEAFGEAMSNLKLARANLAAVLSAEIRRHSDSLCCSKRHWRVRFPELKTWSASFRAAAICAFLVCVAPGTPVMARGGHGMRGFGVQGGHRMGAGGNEGLLTPTYVLITVSKIADAEAFKVTMRDLMAADTPSAGRLAVDMDKPVSWEGTAPEHVVMIQFDNPDQVQVWKNSDAFKTFDAELHPGHTHGPGCGHEAVPHGDHTDYLVNGRLHHPHSGHCCGLKHHGLLAVSGAIAMNGRPIN
jgi:uncharacterized protein (DUF1330 family)